jgi:DNA-binding transcriptional ArsR family regulator
LASLLSLLADPLPGPDPVRAGHRRRAVRRDLAPTLQASEDTVGYAPRILRITGLVTARRHGRMVFYRLADDVPAPLREHCLRRPWSSRVAPG